MPESWTEQMTSSFISSSKKKKKNDNKKLQQFNRPNVYSSTDTE